MGEVAGTEEPSGKLRAMVMASSPTLQPIPKLTPLLPPSLAVSLGHSVTIPRPLPPCPSPPSHCSQVAAQASTTVATSSRAYTDSGGGVHTVT